MKNNFYARISLAVLAFVSLATPQIILTSNIISVVDSEKETGRVKAFFYALRTRCQHILNAGRGNAKKRFHNVKSSTEAQAALLLVAGLGIVTFWQHRKIKKFEDPVTGLLVDGLKDQHENDAGKLRGEVWRLQEKNNTIVTENQQLLTAAKEWENYGLEMQETNKMLNSRDKKIREFFGVLENAAKTLKNLGSRDKTLPALKKEVSQQGDLLEQNLGDMKKQFTNDPKENFFGSLRRKFSDFGGSFRGGRVGGKGKGSERPSISSLQSQAGAASSSSVISDGSSNPQ